jgi:DNA polymerase-3 subunit delta
MATIIRKITNWKDLSDDLQRGIDRPAYIFAGEEIFLIRQATKKIIDTLVPANLHALAKITFRGDGKPSTIDIKRLVSEIATPPLFAQAKVIIVEYSGFFESQSSFSNLTEDQKEALIHIPDRCHVLFIENTIRQSNKLLSAMQANGALTVTIDKQSPRELLRWMSSLCTRYGMRITRDAAESLMFRCEYAMTDIANELETVFLFHRYTEQSDITLEDIDLICREDTTGKIFDLTDAIAEGNMDRALQMLDVMIARREAPLYIQTMLARQTRDLLVAKSCSSAADVLKSGLTKSSFFANKLVSQSKRFTQNKLERMMEDCFHADVSVKTGRLDDEDAVSMLVIRACSAASDATR